MKKRSGWKVLVTAMIMCMVFLVGSEVRAAEPYEKIAHDYEWEVLKEVNRQRLKDGKDAISMFGDLQKAAGVRADEIVNFFSHARPDGTMCFTVFDEYDIANMTSGENIAAGQRGPYEVMNAWMNSSGHRANILTSDYDHIGVGYCTGGVYGHNWTQLFVGGCAVKRVEVNDMGTANYALGTSVDNMNRYLIVRCTAHGVSYVPIVNEMCSGYDPQKTGYQNVTVKYQNKKVKMPVTIGNKSSYKPPKKAAGVKGYAVKKTSLKLKWYKRSGSGYEIWRATSANGTYKKVKTINSAKTTNYRVKNLKSGKKYYFKVRAFKKSGGKKIYGLFSKAVVVKTK